MTIMERIKLFVTSFPENGMADAWSNMLYDDPDGEEYGEEDYLDEYWQLYWQGDLAPKDVAVVVQWFPELGEY